MTQKSDPYTKLFNTLSAVRLMSCIFVTVKRSL